MDDKEITTPYIFKQCRPGRKVQRNSELERLVPITWCFCCDDSMFFHAEFLSKPDITQFLLTLLSLEAYIQEQLTAYCLVSGKWIYTYTHTYTLMHTHRHAQIYIDFPLHIWLFVGSFHINENAECRFNLKSYQQHWDIKEEQNSSEITQSLLRPKQVFLQMGKWKVMGHLHILCDD